MEGGKSVVEVLNSAFTVRTVVGTADFLSSLKTNKSNIEILEAKADVLASLGEFKTNDAALAVVEIPPAQDKPIQHDRFTLVLDDIRDPGNLGTIIRTADWYGISHILASEETVDCYSPKVITSTKGSFTRVSIHYTRLTETLKYVTMPIYGAFLEGNDVHKELFPKAGLLVIGNESKGISEEVGALVTHPLTIPRIGGAESLNAAIATAILLDNIIC